MIEGKITRISGYRLLMRDTLHIFITLMFIYYYRAGLLPYCFRENRSLFQ